MRRFRLHRQLSICSPADPGHRSDSRSSLRKRSSRLDERRSLVSTIQALLIASLAASLAADASAAPRNELLASRLLGAGEEVILELEGSGPPTFTTTTREDGVIVDLHLARLGPLVERELSRGGIRSALLEERGQGVRLIVDLEPGREATFEVVGTRLRVRLRPHPLPGGTARVAQGQGEEEAAQDLEDEAARLAAVRAQEEEARLAALKAQEEEEARLAAAKAKEEEEARLAAAKAKEEEEARLAAVKAKEEEEARLAAVKAQEEEEARLAAAKAQEEEEARLAAANAQAEEEARLAAAQAQAEEEARLAAAKAREEEEARLAAAKAREVKASQLAAATASDDREERFVPAQPKRADPTAPAPSKPTARPPAQTGASAKAISPVPASSRAAAGGALVDISHVGFRQEPDSVLVTIHHTAPTSYRIIETAGKLVVELANSRISTANGRRPLDASFFGTAVGLIRPVEDRGSNKVLVEIALRRSLPSYSVRQHEDELSIQFPR